MIGPTQQTMSKGNATVKLTADIDMERLLEQLADGAMKAARKAVKAGADIGNRDYKARVPVGKTGNLKASIMVGGKVIVKKVKGKGYVGFVGATRPKGPHSHLIEDGHKVVPRGPAGQSNKGSGKSPLTGKARVDGKQDLLHTFQTTRDKSQRAIINSLQDDIIKAGG